jgi:hypothetical protein
MKLLGDWNWYLPTWLDWLPRVGPKDGVDLPPSPKDEDGSIDEPPVPDESEPAPIPA